MDKAAAFRKLIIQIPCYNEAETLKIALENLPRQVKGFSKVEWLLIDDGSTDNTPVILKDALSKFTTLRILRHDVSCGQSTAIRTGWKTFLPHVRGSSACICGG